MSDYSYLKGRNQTIEGLGSGPKRDPNEYKVSYKDNPQHVYQSVIRFLPAPEGALIGNKPYVGKYVTWVVDPRNQKKRCVDNPTTVGERDNQLDELMWSLVKSGDQRMKDIANKYLRRNEQYVALVQIINDPQHPEYNNKIMYMRFGNSINDKILAENAPNNATGFCNPSPFDIFNGRLFSLVVTEKNQQNNYEQSNFISVPNLPCGFRYMAPDGTTRVASDSYMNSLTEEQMNAEMSYLGQTYESAVAAVDITKHEYKPWDEETTKFVNEMVYLISYYAERGELPQAASPYGRVENAPAFGAPAAQIAQQMPMAGMPAAAPVNFVPSTPQVPTVQTVPTAPTMQAAPAAPQVPTAPSMPTPPTTVGIGNIQVPTVNQPSVADIPNEAPVKKSRFGDLDGMIA